MLNNLKESQLKIISSNMNEAQNCCSGKIVYIDDFDIEQHRYETSDQRNTRDMYYRMKQQGFMDVIKRKNTLLKFIRRKSISTLENKVNSIEDHIKTIEDKKLKMAKVKIHRDVQFALQKDDMMP